MLNPRPRWSGLRREFRPVHAAGVGPAPAGATSRGGMATVIALMAAHPDPRIRVTAVPTFVDLSVWQRLRSMPPTRRFAVDC